MSNFPVESLLADHARFLQQDSGLPDTWWLGQRPLPLQTLQSVLPLLWLARRLHDALTPVAPAPAFRQGLRQQLVADQDEPQPEKRWWLGAALVGGVASLAGLGVWALRERRGETAV